MMHNKKIVLMFFGTSLVSVIVFFMVVFYYDPLKILHKPWKYTIYLQNNMRVQAAGIIKYWDFDSMIIGTSMLENTSSQEASKLLGGKFINVSLSGSDFLERKIVLNYALKSKSIKKVLYSLDNIGIVDATQKQSLFKLENWAYLYDDNPMNDIKVYLNSKYLKCLFIPKSKKRCMGKKVDLNRPNAWYKIKNYAERFGGIDNWFKENTKQVKNVYADILSTIHQIRLGKSINNSDIKIKIKQVQEYLDNNLIEIVRMNPNTKFICILPPYSRAKFAIDAQYYKANFEVYKKSIEFLVEKSNIYHNLKIYGWGNYDFLDNMANYKDLQHYEYKINTWMLKKIQKEEGLLTISNVRNYLDTFTQKALAYNLFYIETKIDRYLKKQ